MATGARKSGLNTDDETVLTAMQAEHERLEPLLDRIDTSFVDAGPSRRDLDELATLLDTHMRHEESEALPVVERTIGSAGWESDRYWITRAC